MKVLQTVVHSDFGAALLYRDLVALQPDLVLAFGSVAALSAATETLADVFPSAIRAGCSTAGEIYTTGVEDGSLIVTAVQFQKTGLRWSSAELHGMSDSHACGRRLVRDLAKDQLRAVLLFAQGVNINGSAILAGMADFISPNVPIFGGMAGDGDAFKQTFVLDNLGLSTDRITCVGIYGEALVLSHGSFGGWIPFGPARKVTRCDQNVLYELDGEPALSVYKRYLGEHAKNLPGAGLLFPFAMIDNESTKLGLTRTILGIDEFSGSLILAGDIDPNGFLKLMHASTDSLVDGAETAARAAQRAVPGPHEGLALLVSCVGRKLVMGGRVDEEVESVGEVFGPHTTLAGFYSYGEIGPFNQQSTCKLHNQTMTITYLAEAH